MLEEILNFVFPNKTFDSKNLNPKLIDNLVTLEVIKRYDRKYRNSKLDTLRCLGSKITINTPAFEEAIIFKIITIELDGMNDKLKWYKIKLD
jgi:hypothetical protein